MVRALQAMLYKRIDHDIKQGKKNIQWTDYLNAVLLTHNDKLTHSPLGITPNETQTTRE